MLFSIIEFFVQQFFTTAIFLPLKNIQLHDNQCCPVVSECRTGKALHHSKGFCDPEIIWQVGKGFDNSSARTKDRHATNCMLYVSNRI